MSFATFSVTGSDSLSFPMFLFWPLLCQCPDLIFSVWVCCFHQPQFYFPLVHFLPDSNSLLHPGEFPLVFLHNCVPFVMFPHYIQPPCISTHKNHLGVYIHKSVYIFRMIICIPNKHTCFPSVVQLGSQLFPSCMATTNCYFSKRSQMLHVLCIHIVKQCEWWLCSVWSHIWYPNLLLWK